MNTTKITIPKPCSEDWNKMTPTQEGKHCSSCNKVVVDFTAMSQEEIQLYFKKHAERNVCGHFKTEQVERHIPYLHKKMMRLYTSIEKRVSIHFLKVASLSTITFIMALSGCKEQTVEGEPMPPSNSAQESVKENKDSNSTKENLTCDTTYVNKHDTAKVKIGKTKLITGEIEKRHD